MLIAKTDEVKKFCRKNNLKFTGNLETNILTRSSAISKKNKLLLLRVSGGNDFMKQKNSKLDSFICKTLCEKEKKVFIDLNELFDSKTKTIIIQRIKQNLRLFKKYKVDYELVYFCDSTSKIISNNDILSLKRILEIENTVNLINSN